MLLGWFVDQKFYVPKYHYTDAPPNNRFLEEMVQIYRPALTEMLDKHGVAFHEPVFDARWASDETHRFVLPKETGRNNST